MIVTVQLLILTVATLVSLDVTLNVHHPFVDAVNAVVVGHDAVNDALLTVTVCVFFILYVPFHIAVFHAVSPAHKYNV